MDRKSFIKKSALGLGAVFHMPFTGEQFAASEVVDAFADTAHTDTEYDAIIIGGSFAGLSAAMGLGRCRRTVLLIDDGMPRNRTSARVNNLFSRDGQNPSEVSSDAKAQLESYKAYLSRIDGTASALRKNGDLFMVTHADGRVFRGHTIVIASGVTDNLLEIDGIEQLWGRGVYHCPYCHGWENRDKKTVIIGVGTSALGLASTVANWTSDITYFPQGAPVELDEDILNRLRGFGITVEQGTVRQIAQTEEGIHIRLESSEEPLFFETCYAPGRISANSDIAKELGCELRPNGAVEVNEQYKSSIDGVYAIGDVCSRTNGQVIHAAYSGTVAAAAINNLFLNRRFS